MFQFIDIHDLFDTKERQKDKNDIFTKNLLPTTYSINLLSDIIALLPDFSRSSHKSFLSYISIRPEVMKASNNIQNNYPNANNLRIITITQYIT